VCVREEQSLLSLLFQRTPPSDFLPLVSFFFSLPFHTHTHTLTLSYLYLFLLSHSFTHIHTLLLFFSFLHCGLGRVCVTVAPRPSDPLFAPLPFTPSFFCWFFSICWFICRISFSLPSLTLSSLPLSLLPVYLFHTKETLFPSLLKQMFLLGKWGGSWRKARR